MHLTPSDLFFTPYGFNRTDLSFFFVISWGNSDGGDLNSDGVFGLS